MSNISCPSIAVCIPYNGSQFTLYQESLEELKFWTIDVTIPIVVTFGLIGNILTMITIATFPKNNFSLFYKV